MLMEPCEAWPKIGPAPALDRDAVGQIPGGIPGRVLQHRVDLKDIDAVRLQFGGDLADLGPEQGQRFARQRGGGVDDDGDGETNADGAARDLDGAGRAEAGQRDHGRFAFLCERSGTGIAVSPQGSASTPSARASTNV